LGASSFDFGWAHFSLDEANDCSAGVTLRSFVISPFTGDFVYRLNVDYTGTRVVAHVCASTQVLVLSKKQRFEPRRMVRLGLVAFWFLSVSSKVLLTLRQHCSLQ
jgi:hypothetical protein